MAIITFSTTDECGDHAGLPTPVRDRDRPTRKSIDSWRRSAKTKIEDIIGEGQTDINDTAKFIEMELVKVEIRNVLNGTDFAMELNDEQIFRLNNVFNTYGMTSWEPGANT